MADTEPTVDRDPASPTVAATVQDCANDYAQPDAAESRASLDETAQAEANGDQYWPR